MKKWLIGSVVGAILVFAWQAASWMFLGIHDNTAKYTPNQNEILSALSANLKEEGMYMLPNAPSKKEEQEVRKSMEGKPWASVIYHQTFNGDMTRPMIRAFLVDLALVLLLIFILSKGGSPGFGGFFTGSIAVGLFSFLWTSYMGHIWFSLPWHMIKGDLIDAIAAWGICGLWLGWWMSKK